MEIKKVDFSGIRSGADVSKAVLDQLHEAFSTIGFVTIINHGVEEKVSWSEVIRSYCKVWEVCRLCTFIVCYADTTLCK